MSRFYAILFLVVVIAFGVYEWEDANFVVAGPARRETVVLIPTGAGVSGIAAKLEEAGVIRDATLFAWGVRLRREASKLKAGEYAIPPFASMADIAALLISGKSIQHKLTAAEGLTSQMIYALVAGDTELAGNAGEVPPEGSLLPETYLFTHGTTRADIVARMHRAQEKFLAGAWKLRVPGLPVSTPEQAVILASIVEKETAIPEERRHIAAVFVNRLKRGMKLQSDPTIIYGLTRGYPLGRPIRESDIAGLTPYNTYAIAGLPPTPICNPGKDSILAVLAPEASNDLYFVADGSGGHVFSDNIADHLRNVARWRKFEGAHN